MMQGGNIVNSKEGENESAHVLSNPLTKTARGAPHYRGDKSRILKNSVL
jgi:hypothetical protein